MDAKTLNKIILRVTRGVWSQENAHPKWFQWKAPYLFVRGGPAGRRVALNGEPGMPAERV